VLGRRVGVCFAWVLFFILENRYTVFSGMYMIQFYFLSIFFNVLAGYLLVSGDEGEALEIRPGFSLFSLKDETFKFVLGILSALTGLFKILSPVEGDLPVLGDFVPALSGFAAGFVLVFEYYKNRAVLTGENSETLSQTLIRNKKIVGFIALIAAILHFLFPRALLL
jgi:hypothetical protein